MAGDSSSCTTLCEGDRSAVCGGKVKSSIFAMHMCATTKSELADASEQANIVAGDLDAKIHLASELAEKLQAASTKNRAMFGMAQAMFGKGGGPAEGNLMQEAKVFAGKLSSAAVTAGRVAKKLSGLIKRASEFKDFSKSATITKAERLMEAMAAAVEAGGLSQTTLGDMIRLAKPGKEELRAAAQYYPVMHFVDKKYASAMQTCSGMRVKAPIVGESADGCASSCDAAIHSCIGFNYFGTGNTSLCFLFSGLKSAVYYTGCERQGHMTLLQSKEHSGNLKTEPWDCGSVGRPLQAINEDKKSVIKALDVATGKYELVLEVEKSLTRPAFSKINACGINPVDSIIYCAMDFQRKAFLARIDSSGVGFVAKLPSKGQYSGDFDEKGNFYFNGKKLMKLSEVHLLPAAPVQYSVKKQTWKVVSDIQLGGDMAIVDEDIEGTGVHTYVMSLIDKELKVVRVSPEPAQTWTVKTRTLKGRLPAGGWGAAWKFKNDIYFANDEGRGVYHLDIASINLQEKTASFEKAGDSVAMSSNDGLGCAHARSPFVPVIPPRIEAYHHETPSAEPERETARCMVKLSKFVGTTLKPDPKGKCKQCLKELTHIDQC
eukprot:CAMPEP_0172824952 /NCGR_PEP_ID=MMETSP1075-20121228/18344_1 /TAXON_ID=2916 /ORGANISM="Ceratium fusus, Strain PA161109" /LENGTH=602 /DNA_ID=CAMNT_0013666315 /DNA_START=230 /DNA_END=2038 /DNA_ORIENTATION=-